MSTENLQPTPQEGPDIGRVPPGPETFPELDEPEIGEKGDPTTIKTPNTPRPDIRDDRRPGVPSNEEIGDIINEIRRDRGRRDGPGSPGKKGPGRTIH